MPLKYKRVFDVLKVYLNLIVLLHLDISFLIHNIFMFCFCCKSKFADGLITKSYFLDVYQHYRKQLNYAPRK